MNRACKNYTLVEILVTLAIVGILLAIGMPAFQKIIVGNTVNTTASQLGGMMNLARSQAIVHRKYMAVVLPDKDAAGIANTTYPYQRFRLCSVKYTEDPATGVKEYTFDSWYQGGNWKDAGTGSAAYVLNNSPESVLTPLKDVDVDGTDRNLNSIIFRPNGGAVNNYVVRVIQGVYSAGAPDNADGHKIIVTNADNTKDIIVKRFTGKISYE